MPKKEGAKPENLDILDLENIHVVEEFFNGNALIPHSEYESINRG